MLLDLARARNKDYAPEINQVASNISRVVGDRMRGLIESGIISPITSTLVSASLRHVLDEVGLKEQVLRFFNDPEAVERLKLAEAKKAKAKLKKQEAEAKAKPEPDQQVPEGQGEVAAGDEAADDNDVENNNVKKDSAIAKKREEQKIVKDKQGKDAKAKDKSATKESSETEAKDDLSKKKCNLFLEGTEKYYEYQNKLENSI